MKANKLIPRLWILISLLLTIHITAQNNIVGYEYAFNDGEGLQFVSIAPTPDFNLVTDIDVSILTNDVNVIHIRFLDENGLWSPIISKIFVKPSEAFVTASTIVGYEYGFDDDNPPTYVPITPTANYNLMTDIDVSSLTNDVNVLHIRFKDNIGQWSSIISKIFVKPSEAFVTASTIVGYEYGFDDDNPPTYVPITPTANYNLVTDIDASSLTNDVNVFHIRFKDDIGQWSSIISKIFVKPPEAFVTASTIVGYEYGFDDDDPPTYVPITTTADFNLVTAIDVSALTNDINVFHIRFKDDIGQWSSIISKIFVKLPEPVTFPGNTIVAYDYWFDYDESTKVTVDVETPATDLLVAQVNMTQLWAGEHTLHMQFKDVYHQYSVVMTDTIDKQVLPIASFVTNTNSICVGETVNFSNNSIDYDTVTWNFDDGNSSTDFNTTHTFNTAGTFEVTLTVSESTSGLDSIATKNIQVYSIPANTVTTSGPLQACFGSTVTLTADDTDADYLWSTGATSRSIEVTANGTYNVTLTNRNGSGCSVVSDDMVIIFDSEIDNSVTLEENLGFVQLTANQSGATYQWIDCTNGNINIDGETGKTFTPNANGTYAVNVTVNNCTVTSDCQTITSLDVNDFSVYNFVKLYPNPVQDKLTVKTEIPLFIEICNINGMVIRTLKFNRGTNNIDLKMLNSGLYFFKIKETSDTGSQRQGVFKILKN